MYLLAAHYASRGDIVYRRDRDIARNLLYARMAI